MVRSLPKREAFAAEQLGLRGYETFLPRIQTKRASAPLFSSYFFIRIVDQWRVINRTLGVLCLVRVGDCPARCPDSEIEALRNRMDSTGVIRLPPPAKSRARHVFAKGERVRILAGPLQGFAALHTGLSAAEKEILLIGMLGAQRRIAIAESSGRVSVKGSLVMDREELLELP